MRAGVVAAIVEFIAEVAVQISLMVAVHIAPVVVVQIAPVKEIHHRLAQSHESMIMNGDRQ